MITCEIKKIITPNKSYCHVFLPLNILFILVYKSNDKEEEFIIYYKVKKLLCYENNVKYASKS